MRVYDPTLDSLITIDGQIVEAINWESAERYLKVHDLRWLKIVGELGVETDIAPDGYTEVIDWDKINQN